MEVAAIQPASIADTDPLAEFTTTTTASTTPQRKSRRSAAATASRATGSGSARGSRQPRRSAAAAGADSEPATDAADAQLSDDEVISGPSDDGEMVNPLTGRHARRSGAVAELDNEQLAAVEGQQQLVVSVHAHDVATQLLYRWGGEV